MNLINETVTEEDIKNLEEEISHLTEEIQKLMWEMDSPQCCLEDEFHLIIVTSDNKGIHTNELFVEEKCPYLKEISNIYFERGVKHFKVEIEFKIMAEIVKFIEYGADGISECKYSEKLVKTINMLEMKELKEAAEIAFLWEMSYGNALELLKFAEKNALKIMKHRVIEFIASNFENMSNHHQWKSFSENNFNLFSEIINRANPN